MVKRAAPIAILLTLVALGASACNNTTTGSPTPGSRSGTTTDATQDSTAPTSTSTSDPLANVDPCTLMDPAVLSQNGLQQGTSGTEVGARVCRWQHNADSSGAGFTVGVGIYDHAGLDQLNTTDFSVSSYPLAHHQGRISRATSLHTCDVSIAITSNSRVDIIGVDGAGNLDAACKVATDVAPSVEQRLPAGG